MILGLLLGNTSLRYGLFDGDAILEPGRASWEELPLRGPELTERFRQRGVDTVVAGSVRDDLLPSVSRWLPSGLPPIQLARRDFELQIPNRYARPEDAGTDRLLNAIAVRARSGGRSAVAVDFGTAVSFSVVSGEGAFLGGPIAAGGRAMLAGLRAVTPRLPPVVLERPGRLLSRETRAALVAGLYTELAGGVRSLLQGLLGELGPGPTLVLATGGEASLIAAEIPEIHEVVENLTLEGLRIAWSSHR
jgi:type III pantothenate kinase